MENDGATRGRRPLSARRPLAHGAVLPLMALGLLAGQALAQDDVVAALLIAAALAAPALVARHRRLGAAATLVVLSALAGHLQIAWQTARREQRLAHVDAGMQTFRGRVAAVRLGDGRGGVRATLDVALEEPAAPLSDGERLRLTMWRTRRAWRVGERVGFRAAPRAPRGFCNRGEDGYVRWLWRSGVVATASVDDDLAVRVAPRPRGAVELDAVVDDARAAIGRALERAVDADAGRGVLRALVIGDQSRIPTELRRAYARTGTAHVLSVSGLHIALVAMTVYGAVAYLLARWPWLALRVVVARVAALAALPPALAYTALSGGAVATLRSLVMAAIGLGAVVLVRRPDPWTALAAAALVLAAIDPGIGSDPSFQLSFASVAALVVAGGWLQQRLRADPARWLARERLAGRLGVVVLGALTASCAAALATAPITAFHFGTVSVIGVVANLVVVPLVGWLALLLALSGTVALCCSQAIADHLLWLAALAVEPANCFVAWLAARPWAALDWSVASPATVLGLAALAAAAQVGPGRRRAALLALAALLVAAGIPDELRAWHERRLVVRFLDVGQGDASLVVLPAHGGAVLVDAGGLGGSFDPGERVVLPALRRAGVRGLDAIALSHPDFDHYGGMAAVVRATTVDEFWSSGRTSHAATFAELRLVLAEEGVQERPLARGDRLPIPSAGAEIGVLSPPPAAGALSQNDASLVLRVTFGATRVLFTGDVEQAAETALVARRAGLAATVIKVPHHGSRTSSTRALVAASRPALAVAMLGWRNRFGFPAPKVRERYGGFGAAWRETARDGEVVLVSDGQLESVRTCR